MKLGSNQALCCSADDLDVLGTGGFSMKIGKEHQWHNIYVCRNCKRVFFELADFGDVVHLFYTKKGTTEYQKDLMQAKKDDAAEAPSIILGVNVFVPKRGGFKVGVKTNKGYRAHWFQMVPKNLRDIPFQQWVEWGYDNIKPFDVSNVVNMIEVQLRHMEMGLSKRRNAM